MRNAGNPFLSSATQEKEPNQRRNDSPTNYQQNPFLSFGQNPFLPSAPNNSSQNNLIPCIAPKPLPNIDEFITMPQEEFNKYTELNDELKQILIQLRENNQKIQNIETPNSWTSSVGQSSQSSADSLWTDRPSIQRRNSPVQQQRTEIFEDFVSDDLTPEQIAQLFAQQEKDGRGF
jgi:hypothetical protein